MTRSVTRPANSTPSCGLAIDHELKFRGLLDRQLGWLLTFENATGVGAGQAVRIGYARSVAHQTTRRRVLAQHIACREPMAGRQRNQLAPTGIHERASADKKR